MDVDDLSRKIRHYLKHEDKREPIADAGYRKAATEHTFARRFTEIADRIFGKHRRAGGFALRELRPGFGPVADSQ